MINGLNIMPAICALLVCILIIFSNNRKVNSKSIQYKYFRYMSYTLLCNIIITICRHSINNIVFKYLFTLLYHSSNSILYLFALMYCLSLFPKVVLNFDKYRNFFIKVYLGAVAIILSSPLTHFVYYLDGETIVKGPLAFISFFVGYATMVFIIYFMIAKRASKGVKANILVLILTLLIPSFIDFLLPTLVFSTFGYACGLILIYENFHCNTYDIFYGTNKDDLLFKRFSDIKNKKSETTLILLEFTNLEHLYSKISKKECNIYISDIFRNCEKMKLNPEIFSWNNKFVILLNTNKAKDVDEFITSLIYFIEISPIKEDLTKLEYKILYMSTPSLVDTLNDLNKISVNEQIYEFTLEDKEKLDYRKKLSKQLKDIFNLKDFSDPRVEVYYQPILDVKSNKFLSAEALSRIYIKDLGGIIYPDVFIPLLEEFNYIHNFSLIVLNKVCCYIKSLEKEGKEFEGISVNFSLKEFMDPNFEKDIVSIVLDNKVSPSRIHLEITESIEAQDLELIKDKIINLKNLGFKFYLDDFGTGYSNLSEIIELPFDVVKFDRSLVLKSIENNDTKDITTGIANLLASKDFKVLFEGIEDLNSENMCKDMKASFLQGYKYSKPIKASEVVNFFGKSPDEIKKEN